MTKPISLMCLRSALITGAATILMASTRNATKASTWSDAAHELDGNTAIATHSAKDLVIRIKAGSTPFPLQEVPYETSSHSALR